MSQRDFELTIICNQAKSLEVIEEIKKLGLSFDIKNERAFAPSTQEIAVTIVVGLLELLPLIAVILKRIREKEAIIDFKDRLKLAKKMLADLEPLYMVSGKDTRECSYYVFKTPKCKHFWELDRGEIKHGPLGCS